ncbi:MAG TPA: M6 family metalloprotease domain-containing protein, partial [Candidatus Hydrogenedentes bacterium]|nr:M6 family metalloprotease domain-containing protein [Candidatus Hydrogenedentota bacterium]
MRKVFSVRAFFGIVLLVAAYSQMAEAVPAWPGVIEATQPDGTNFSMRLRGDEFFSWTETADGYVIVRDEGDGFWKYAMPMKAGTAFSPFPDAVVGRTSPERLGLKPGALWEAAVMRDARKMREVATYSTDKSGGRPPSRIPVSGKSIVRNVVILAAFDDHWDEINNTVLSTKGRVDAAEYDALFNEENHSANMAVGSVRDYYHEVSYGNLIIESLITSWVRLPQDEAYYGANNVYGQDSEPRQMTADAIEAAAAAGFDFSQGDSDGDGWVDGLTIIHSGHGEEEYGNPSTSIWSHQWEMTSVATKDGVKMLRYHTSPALRGNTGSTAIIRIGVICHEMGHFFGLPDLYDYSGMTLGIGSWGIMAFGSWNGGDGKSPAHFCAWSKYMLGFLRPEQRHSGVAVELAGASTAPVAHLYRDGMGNGEYFLVENRTNDGFDDTVEISPGMLIYHIDDKSNNNDLDTWQHPAVKIEEGDGNDSLGAKAAYFEAGDVWHAGSGLAGGFGDVTGSETTNAMRYQSHYYNRADDADYYSFITLDGFSAAGDVMTYNATTLKTSVISRSVTQPDYVVDWPPSANAEKYELQEGFPITLEAFSDGAESEEAMYANWHVSGSVQRSADGRRTGIYSYVMQPFDGARYYSTVQSLLLREPFILKGDTVFSFYYLSRLDTGNGYLRAQISNDAGETWHTLGEYSGDTLLWTLRSYDYAALSAPGINIGDSCIIRFIANFENVWGWTSFPAYGYALDDISINNTAIASYGNWTPLDDAITDTYYPLEGKADGDYAYRVRAYANDAWQGFGEVGTITVAVSQRTVVFETDGTPGASLDGTLSQTVYSGSDCTPVTANPPEGYRFESWTLDGALFSTDNPLTVDSVHADMILVANFTLKSYTLTYTAGANGALSGETTQTVFHGADGAAVEALPNAGYHFVQWSDGSVENPRVDAAVTENIAVEAGFDRTYYTLSLEKTGEGDIKLNTNIVALPWSGDVVEDMTIVLRALPADGWQFTGWSGDLTGTLNPKDFDMTKD